MKKRAELIMDLLPYDSPFSFVDELTSVSPDGIQGIYNIKEDEYFLMGHFKQKPIVPGVIIAEIMSQIGLVSLGINLLLESYTPEEIRQIQPVFSNCHLEFNHSVGPGATLEVVSKKVFFRLGKLHCKVKCTHGENIVAQGEMGGLFSKFQ